MPQHSIAHKNTSSTTEHRLQFRLPCPAVPAFIYNIFCYTIYTPSHRHRRDSSANEGHIMMPNRRWRLAHTELSEMMSMKPPTPLHRSAVVVVALVALVSIHLMRALVCAARASRLNILQQIHSYEGVYTNIHRPNTMRTTVFIIHIYPHKRCQRE